MHEGSTENEPGQLALRDASTAGPVDGLDANREAPKPPPRYDKLSLILGPLGPRLRGFALERGTSISVLVRRAILRMLDDEGVPCGTGCDAPPFEHSARNVHFHLNLPLAYSAELTARARAADMTRGEFVWSLLKGNPPPALPSDHAMAVQALRLSTDRVAAMSTDISEFLRLMNKATATRAELEPHRTSIRALDATVREHLKVASVLIQELKPYRRARW